MRTGVAFKFIGKLAKDVQEVTQNISTGNVIGACIEAGIALIDFTSSIVSYSSECTRSSILKDQITDSEQLLDSMRLKAEENARVEIAYAKDVAIKYLNKLKLKLCHEFEENCKFVNLEKQKLKQSLEVDKKKNEIIGNVRKAVLDTLDFSNEMLTLLNEKPGKNQARIADLEEQIRVSTATYDKMIKMCI